MTQRPLRAMWLLNHTAARKFEIPMLKGCGFTEIFLPKFYPISREYRSGSVDWSEDKYLTIPKEELEILNAADWYKRPTRQAWAIANRRFDIAFFIANYDTFREITENFEGAAIYRPYGLDASMSYDALLNEVSSRQAKSLIRKRGGRFWFGEVFSNIHEIEPDYLSRHAIHLPIGLPDSTIDDSWTGSDKRILFVCPDVEGNSYYAGIYSKFKNNFDGFEFVVAGAQYLTTKDERILGFLPPAEYNKRMREHRLMYYHSSEPRHLHYHPIEAIKVGMPLLYMAGGILEKLGGPDQPGLCKTINEARSKAQRILIGDEKFIERVRTNQREILDAISADKCQVVWNLSISKVLNHLGELRRRISDQPLRKIKIAVVLPVEYKGGTLTAAKLIAQALARGSRQAGDEVQIIFAHVDDDRVYSEDDFSGLYPEINVRPFKWKVLGRRAAERACLYKGETLTGNSNEYLVPDDGISQFKDCELLLFISDRLARPLLPIYRYAMVVFDYIQRHVKVVTDVENEAFIAAARNAIGVVTTTSFTAQNAIHYAGLKSELVHTAPSIIPQLCAPESYPESDRKPYFIWTTNLGAHKNHSRAIEALSIYYHELGGQQDCVITGTQTDGLLTASHDHLNQFQKIISSDRLLRRRIRILGEISEPQYRSVLKNAKFLFHPTIVDNGSFSVIEAALLGVPSLSSKYPSMEEVCRMINITPMWMDHYSARDIAEKLDVMSKTYLEFATLTSENTAGAYTVDNMCGVYWSIISSFLPMAWITF
jgi:glycosyltransferase involved in cell wall biosynthesis